MQGSASSVRASERRVEKALSLIKRALDDLSVSECQQLLRLLVAYVEDDHPARSA
jgi:hypothetical protein